jgi:hypothetical protein
MPESLGPGHAASVKPLEPSAYWGEQKLWDTRANNHNSMFDEKGRLWLSATVRGIDNPAFCKQGSDHPSAKVFPLEKSARAMLDPKTMKYSFIDTCFATHHLQFGYDADDTLWLSGTGPVAGWIHTKMFDETGVPKGRKAGRRSSSTPTATASATIMSSPTPRSIRTRTNGSSRVRDLTR